MKATSAVKDIEWTAPERIRGRMIGQGPGFIADFMLSFWKIRKLQTSSLFFSGVPFF